MKVLVINSGSSSIKYKVFSMPLRKPLAKGLIEHIGEAGSSIQDHYTGLKMVLAKIDPVVVAGHRVVHGGEKFKRPVVIDASVIKKIKQCSDIAPLHNPANLAGIEACKKLLPHVRQVAVFDTAFYQTLADHVYTYGLPYLYYRKWGIRKYGFHGTSHEFVAHEAAAILKKPINRLNIITCHLGNGCSITAVRRGSAVDTSMGFTPLEGLVMGTRCGDIDPALVTYVMRKEKLDPHRVEEILNKESGLKGISGFSNDMRLLEARSRNGDARSKLAINVFIYRIRKYIGAYTAIMGGCDALVFTAGIGENQKEIRERICEGIFSHLKHKPRVLVVPTDEEYMIAHQAYRLIKGR